MNESYLIAAAALLLIIILGITGEAIWKHLTRERGPWVVTRVGVGGREFLGVGTNWVTSLDWASTFVDQKTALQHPEALLADVAPLSKYTGVK